MSSQPTTGTHMPIASPSQLDDNTTPITMSSSTGAPERMNSSSSLRGVSNSNSTSGTTATTATTSTSTPWSPPSPTPTIAEEPAVLPSYATTPAFQTVPLYAPYAAVSSLPSSSLSSAPVTATSSSPPITSTDTTSAGVPPKSSTPPPTVLPTAPSTFGGHYVIASGHGTGMTSLDALRGQRQVSAQSVQSPQAGGTYASEYSVSNRGGNHSQSFHQDSIMHSSGYGLDIDDRDHGHGVGLMDPGQDRKLSPKAPLPSVVLRQRDTSADRLTAGAGQGTSVQMVSLNIIEPSSLNAAIVKTQVTSPPVGSPQPATSPNVAARPSTPKPPTVPSSSPLTSASEDDALIDALTTKTDPSGVSPDPIDGGTDFYRESDKSETMKRSKKKKKTSCLSKFACPASCGGYNMVKVFVILTTCQIILTCVAVWLIGYLGLIAATSELSSQVRSAVMFSVTNSINQQLGVPLRAVSNLSFMTRQRWPDFATRTEVTETDGFLADLFMIGVRYPNLVRVGVFNTKNVYMTLQRSAAGKNFTSPEKQYILINDPATDTLSSYQPVPIPERNLLLNAPPLLLMPEIQTTDSAEFIKNYLGTPIYSTNFKVSESRSYQSIIADVERDGLRKVNPSITDLKLGWTPPHPTIDRTGASASSTFLSLVAFQPTVDATTGELTMASFVTFKLQDLETTMRSLPYGDHGMIHLARAGGDIVASSWFVASEHIANTQTPYKFLDSDNGLIQKTGEYLREWGVIRAEPTSNVSITQVPYQSQQFSAGFSYDGAGWRIEAQMLDPESSGLPFTVVLVTKDTDFDGGVQAIIRNTAIVCGVICLIAMFLTLMITRCVTRPLLSVVDYMSQAVKVISMDRGQLQREALGELCENWSAESGMIMPPLLNSSAKHSELKEVDPFNNTPLYASFCWLCNDQGDTCCCYRVGRSLREVQMMHAAFGSMLYTLASYDELEAINQAKRQFIRYIFHEVRVPFNAIVMGIEQMQLELAPHGIQFSSTIETLDILREQSAVVSRILNDVLSMQKIEDGALALEYDTFSLEKMIRGALYAFRTPCLEKRLKVRVNLANLDELVNEHLPGLRLGKVRIRSSKNPNSSHAGTTAFGTSTGGMNGTGPGTGGHTPFGADAGSSAATHGSTTGDGAAGNAQAQRNYQLPAFQHPLQRNSTQHSNTMGSETGHNQAETYHAQVRGDPYRLRQCLANFVSNAIKFTPPFGLVRVSLDVSRFEVNPLASIASDQLLISMGLDPKHRSSSRASKANAHHSWHQPPPINQTLDGSDTNSGGNNLSSPNGSTKHTRPIVPELLGTVMVKVSVKDSGSGIPLEHQAHIFEAYHQVQAGKIQKGNGTGLGLNISKSIVELHGGQISYTSVAGEGADFFFQLPMDVMLVRLGSKGDSSSYGGGTSHTPARSDNHSQMSERKLETIIASPDIPPREIGAGAAKANGSKGSGKNSKNGVSAAPSDVGSQSHPSTPGAHAHLPLLTSHPSNVSVVPRSVQHVVDDDHVVTFHDEVDATETRPLMEPSPASGGIKGSNTTAMPPSHPINGAHATHPSVSSTGVTSSNSNGTSISPDPDASFYGTGTSTTANSRSRSRGLRGPNLGVSIPSGTGTTGHSSAQNLTASVRSAGASAGGTSAGGTTASVGAASGTFNTGAAGRAGAANVSGSPNALTNLRVLVVEDSQPNRKLLLSLLTHMGCKAIGVENGQECVDLFKDVMTTSPSSKTQHLFGVSNAPPLTSASLAQSQLLAAATHGLGSSSGGESAFTRAIAMMPCDIILMDGSMPVLNGVEATQILRQHGVLVPIIAVTGNALAEDVSAFMTAGANAVLTKPIARKRLMEVLQQYAPMRAVAPPSYSSPLAP